MAIAILKLNVFLFFGLIVSTFHRHVYGYSQHFSIFPGLLEVNTDDENEEMEYEAWKLRELKRMKRDREEKEAAEKEREEIERLRNMTEDERRMEAKNNPKVVTNKATKGKYKFMQKYYHRGAFFMADEVSGIPWRGQFWPSLFWQPWKVSLAFSYYLKWVREPLITRSEKSTLKPMEVQKL